MIKNKLEIKKEDDIKYGIIDIECIKGLFTLQLRSEKQSKASIIECYDDKDCYKVYRALAKNTRALYCYSIGYDKAMINALGKFIEKDTDDIVNKLKRFNDYLIAGNIEYFRLNREFWCEIYYPLKEKGELEGTELFKEAIEVCKLRHHDNKYVSMFLDEFPYVLGKSKLFKSLNIIDIPKMLYYFSIRKDGIVRTSISLKNIQLFEEGYNIVHNFEEIFDVEKLKEEGLFEDFIKYSLNDVDFLFRYFEKKCLPVIKQRYHACKAIQRFKPDFEYTDDMIHSENNTNLLINAFSLPQQESSIFEDDFISEIDYLTECSDGTYKYEGGEFIPQGDEFYISQFNNIIEKHKIDNPNIESIYDNIQHTGYKEFDELVDFVKNNNHIKKDKTLKEEYCKQYDLKYNNDGYSIEHEGRIQTVVDKFNEFILFGTKVVVGLGGIHGAIENYIKSKLYHLDYRSLYPSIILQFKQYYKRIINIELYEALYNFRNFEVKPEIAKLKKELKSIYDRIEANGNEYLILDIESKIKELENLSDGAKLLLNSLYGLINSEFNFSISNKILGRFICLYGQYKAISLCKLVNKHSKITNNVNVNTDGLILDNLDDSIVAKIVEEDRDGYLVLGINKIDRLIQIDVNNYIKFVNGEMKTKGTAFGTGLKQAFNNYEKLTCNIENALTYINNGTNIKILPVLFNQKSKKKSAITLEGEDSSKNKVYYLTNKERGKIAVKHVANPIILSWGGEVMYFTENKDDADIREYIKFARITEEKILTFTLLEKDNFPYFKYELTPDIDKANIKLKNGARLALNKIFPKKVCYNGYKGSYANVLTIDTKVIPDLANYNMTTIKKSTEVQGISILNVGFTCIATKNKNDILELSKYETFTVWHKSGSCMYIFNENVDIDMTMFEDSKIIFNEYVPVWSLNGDFKNNNCNIKDIIMA